MRAFAPRENSPASDPSSSAARSSQIGKRMICRGEVKTPAGMQTYIEDFDWLGASPHR